MVVNTATGTAIPDNIVARYSGSEKCIVKQEFIAEGCLRSVMKFNFSHIPLHKKVYWKKINSI